MASADLTVISGFALRSVQADPAAQIDLSSQATPAVQADPSWQAFCSRVRTAGYRIIVEPQAEVTVRD